MCTNPTTTINEHGEEITFSCRNCDECIATRKNDWIARGMAEMAAAEHTYILNLTYRNTLSGKAPASARAFRYKDVQRFLYKIRAAARDKYGKGVEIRYICCGERGSQKDRVHWHMILYSSHDLYNLGKWYDFFFTLIGQPRPTRMDHWSFWEHGHIVTDEANQKSMAYILKYIIKDQFNVVRSRGNKRFAKSENHGASMFRMSKKPPIGWRFIESKLARLRAVLAVPPSVQIAIPNYSGYLWPRGKIRQDYLTGLREINETCRTQTGRNCAAWNTLVASLSENETDLETLNVISVTQEEETTEEFRERLDLEQARRNREHARTQTKRRCGGLDPCKFCLGALSEEETSQLERWQAIITREWEAKGSPGPGPYAYFRSLSRANPFCYFKEEVHVNFRFPRS